MAATPKQVAAAEAAIQQIAAQFIASQVPAMFQGEAAAGTRQYMAGWAKTIADAVADA